MTASPASVAPPNETLDAAYELGHLNIGSEVEELSSIGTGAAGPADVVWYTFTLDQPAQIVSTLGRQSNDSSFQGVISLFNNDPDDFGDPYDLNGHRLLDQVEMSASDAPATLDQLLGQGTYYLAVSGAGNLYFNPLLADSGIPGKTGNFDLCLSASDSPLAPTIGPQVLTTDPAPSAVLASSPLAIRIEMSSALDPSTLIPGDTVQLLYSANDSFSSDATPISLASVNFPGAVEDPPSIGQGGQPIQHYEGINELQLFPASPLSPGYYEVFLAGNSAGGAAVITDVNGNNLNADAGHPDGRDFAYEFQVNGIDGRTGPDASSDDTPATAQNLGNVSSAGLIQVPGAIGDDPFYGFADSPGNQVDMYQFQVTGPGNYALVAEIFAGRIGSPLQGGLSLFELNSSNGALEFISGNINSYDPVVATDGLSTPLYTDSVLFASLTAGTYYIAVADGTNTASPFENQPVGSPGLFDPNISHSGQNGFSTGPYVLNLLVQPAPSPPRVVSSSPSNGATLTQPPTQLTVTFSEPVNIAQLALQTYQVAADEPIASVYIEGPGGTLYYPRFESYDSTTNQATFLMLNALPNGMYELHLSGSAGLTDLGGNALTGNDSSGDYVVHFTVNAPARGANGDPFTYTDQEPNDDIQDPQNLGVIFPYEFANGVTISRDFSQEPSQAPSDTQDVYEFQVLLDGYYSFTLSGNNLPANISLNLTDPTGQSVPILSIGGTLLVGEVTPGTYLLVVNGWSPEQAPSVSYQISLNLVSTNDNAPPLVTGPSPAIAIRLTSTIAPPTPSPPVSIDPPPTITPPLVSTDPSSPTGNPAPTQTSIDVPALSLDAAGIPEASPLGVNVLATSSFGGVTGPGASLAAPAHFAGVSTASPVTTALITLTTAFPILGHAENLGNPAPEGTPPLELTTSTIEIAPARVASPPLSDTVSWLAAVIGDLLPTVTVGKSPEPDVSIDPELSFLEPIVLTDGAAEVLRVPVARRSTASEPDFQSRDWGKVYSFAASFIGLATVWYTRRRERCRRVPSGSQWSTVVGADCPTTLGSSRPFHRTRFRLPGTSHATVRSLEPRVMEPSPQTNVMRRRPLPPLPAGGGNND